MHIIIVGAGRTGRHIIELAIKDRHEVFVIEKNEELAEEISTDFDCKVIVDDATSSDALKEAEAEDADALITTTNDDAVNMLVMMIAKESGIKNLISLVVDENHLHLFDKLGVETIDSPYLLNAQHLYYFVENPSIKDFLDLGGGVEITKFTVKSKSPVKGKSLEELSEMKDWPEDSRIVVIKREDEVLIPLSDVKLAEEDSVAILAKKEDVNKINKFFEEQN